MTDLLLTVAVTAVVAGAGFAVVAFVLDRTPGMAKVVPDGTNRPLPEHALTKDDIRAVRFDVAVRGYRMAQVDAAMRRVGEELDSAHRRVAQLESVLAEVSTEINAGKNMGESDER